MNELNELRPPALFVAFELERLPRAVNSDELSEGDLRRLVATLGPEGLCLDSDAGDGAGDLLALPRAADRMVKMGLSEAVVRRVCGGNALSFLGVEPDGMVRVGLLHYNTAADVDRLIAALHEID